MKSLLEFKSIVEEEASDYSKFDVLIRAGLANKAQMQRIHKILDKMGEEKPTFNNADRMIIQNLFNKMVDVITNNKQIYQKTRQVVRENIEEEIEEPIILQEDKDPPLVLVIKRKAIRMYPDGTRIALYYNERLQKYFSVPYQYGPGMDAPIQSEEVEQIDELSSNLLDRYKEKAKKSSDSLASQGKYKQANDRTLNVMKATGKQIEKTTANIRKHLNKEEVELEEASNDPWKDKHFGPTKIIKQKYHVKTDTKSYNVKADNEDHAHKLVTNHAPGSKIVSIEHKGRIMEETIDEAVMDTLHKIVDNKSAQSVKFASGHTRKVDHFTASAITQVHKALNDENKKKFADMVHKSPEHFMKASDFAFKRAK